MFEEEFYPYRPVGFFQLGFDCPFLDLKGWQKAIESKKDYTIPDASSFCDEAPFAKVAMGWNPEGLAFMVSSSRPYKQSVYPEVSRGDCAELFIDTRDVKTSGYNTRFCHHFFFLPAAVDGVQAGEMTRFRTEDTHPLCDPKELQLDTLHSSKGYVLKIFIPSQCLTGYDPEQFDRLGFTYRISQAGGQKQHFSVVSDEYGLEQQPSLWSSVRLKK
jgi:hypothetical protein